MSKLNGSITNSSDITSITVSESHNTPSTSLVVNTKTTSLNIGSSVDAAFGYVGNMPNIFSGWVKQIEKKVPDNTYVITANDEMVKATDFFIASDTPDDSYKARNISAEDLVEAVFNMAQITSYSHDTSYFTFGITRDVEVNLVSAYDFAKTIADILAYSIWCDNTRTAYFKDRRPYVMGSDTSYKTVNGILNITRRLSDRDLRNRVVVYGATGIYAVAEAESPYLPAGFRKSVVVASPWIDDQDMAQAACDYNLDKFNRLTEEVTVELIGDPDLHARQVITISETHTGISGLWYIYACEHRWGQGGYTTNLELRK